jgi:hypothetical protein
MLSTSVTVAIVNGEIAIALTGLGRALGFPHSQILQLVVPALRGFDIVPIVGQVIGGRSCHTPVSALAMNALTKTRRK